MKLRTERGIEFHIDPRKITMVNPQDGSLWVAGDSKVVAILDEDSAAKVVRWLDRWEEHTVTVNGQAYTEWGE